jgi:hypothetical protein
MNALFPPGEITFQKVTLDGTTLKDWKATELNLKANVVCEPCNNNWMSDIEFKHAKPAMSDLILGKRVGEITPKRTRGIALFAFKTAVIANHMLPESEEFFEIAERYAFRESHRIPPTVAMWLFGCEANIAGALRNHNVTFSDEHGAALTLNVCTFSVGQFGFQLVSGKTDSVPEVQSISMPRGLVVRFHPTLSERSSWPRSVVLGWQGFDDFHARWNRVKF